MEFIEVFRASELPVGRGRSIKKPEPLLASFLESQRLGVLSELPLRLGRRRDSSLKAADVPGVKAGRPTEPAQGPALPLSQILKVGAER